MCVDMHVYKCAHMVCVCMWLFVHVCGRTYGGCACVCGCMLSVCIWWVCMCVDVHVFVYACGGYVYSGCACVCALYVLVVGVHEVWRSEYNFVGVGSPSTMLFFRSKSEASAYMLSHLDFPVYLIFNFFKYEI